MNQPKPSQTSLGHSKSGANDKDLYRIMFVFYWVMGGAMILTFAGAGGLIAGLTAALWAVAGLSVGTFAGFLFGIPKTKQADSAGIGLGKAAESSKERTYQSLVNTNLIEISDWLTKIIVGLGLINLAKIPDHVRSVAQVLATSLSTIVCGRDYTAYSIGIVVAFVSLGFLFGYLFTRLYLASAFARADLNQIETRETAEAAGASVESLRDAFEVLRAEIRQSKNNPSEEASVRLDSNRPESSPAPGDALTSLAPRYETQLLALAKTYNEFESNSREERVRIRDEHAGSMAAIINANSGARSWVADTALAEKNIGLIAGLATAMNAIPQSGDPEKILSLAGLVPYKHARYKVATALGRLFESGVATSKHLARTTQILYFYYNNQADDSLRRRIRYTISQIAKSTGETIESPES